MEDSASHRPRVCILADANPFSWVPHYVNAFKRHCDVITIGPTMREEQLKDWDLTHHRSLLYRNDIEVAYDAMPDIRALLPAGWVPDLVVGISHPEMAILRSASTLRCPTALVVIDTWQCPDDYLVAHHYDFVFAAQREFVEKLRAGGARHVEWLPLACAQESHYPVDVPREYDVSFVGSFRHRVHRQRGNYIEVLQKNFRTAIQDRIFGREVCEVMCRGKLMFNHCAVEELNMRVFEAMAMGGPMLVNVDACYNGLLDLFEDRKHLIVYQNEGHLLSLVREFLDDSEARNRIGRAGLDEVLAKHTYTHRAEQIVTTVRRFAPQRLADSAPLSRITASLRDALPSVLGKVVDVGLGLDTTKYAMRRAGAESFAGIAMTAEDAIRRGGSYDQIATWPCAIDGPVDTIAISNIEAFQENVPVLMASIATALRDGGEFVVHLPSNVDQNLFSTMLRGLGLCVVLFSAVSDEPGSPVLCTARKRSRGVRALFLEALERIPDHGVPLDAVRDGIPEYL